MTLLNLTAMSHDVVVRKEKTIYAPSGPPINRLEGGEKMGGRTDGRFRQVFCLVVVVTERVSYSYVQYVLTRIYGYKKYSVQRTSACVSGKIVFK